MIYAGVGGWVCLCLSMQFLIFVKINSKSLAPWGYSLPGNLMFLELQGHPSALEPLPQTPFLLQAPHLIHLSAEPCPQFPDALLAPCAWLFCHLAESTLGGRCSAWAGGALPSLCLAHTAEGLSPGFPNQSELV